MWKVDNNENKNDEEDNSNWLVQICWDWPSCSGEDYINTVIHIYIFPILPLFSFWYLCFEQIWVPFSQGCILPSLNEIAWPCGSEGEYENVKNFTIPTDKSQLTFISGELKRGNVYTWLFGTACLIKNNLSYYASSIHYRLLIAKEFVYLWTENNWMDSTDCTNHYILCTCSLVTQKSTTIS